MIVEAKGKHLDKIGLNYGIKRKKWFIFWESDLKYKQRIVKTLYRH